MEGAVNLPLFDYLLQVLVLYQELVNNFLFFGEWEPNDQVCFQREFGHL
jgi:hypothetical protein